MLWVGYALVLANALLGWRLAERCPRYAPVPAVLAVTYTLNLLRELVLPSTFDARVFLLFPTLSTGLALRVLAPRALAAALLPPALGLTGAPWLAVEVAAAVIQVAAAVWSSRGRHTLRLPERAVLLLVAGDAAALVGPWLGEYARYWPAGVIQTIVIQGVLCYFHASWLTYPRRGDGYSRSAPSWSSPLLH